MARHVAPKTPRRTLLRAGLTVTAVGAALAAGAGGAQAAPAPAAVSGVGTVLDEIGTTPGEVLVGSVEQAVAGGLAPAKNLRLDPLAGTAADPLDNTVGTQIADFKPIGTGAVTAPLTEGAALKDLPVAGTLTKILPG